MDTSSQLAKIVENFEGLYKEISNMVASLGRFNEVLDKFNETINKVKLYSETADVLKQLQRHQEQLLELENKLNTEYTKLYAKNLKILRDLEQWIDKEVEQKIDDLVSSMEELHEHMREETEKMQKKLSFLIKMNEEDFESLSNIIEDLLNQRKSIIVAEKSFFSLLKKKIEGRPTIKPRNIKRKRLE
ncbi:hypothetical protein Calkr_2585 [Caldicellulosiruptor acetigenus I77R1B]|uniref:Uncharacterized protein n=1 Tax=Caldicellulosiruptor acetigenus (strain ATCC 700853 / DSM 12137 / I77R1B) TaxID=632335 RepID=E4S904_CALA7|nr:hypothetical protein [Caldicellulosiruptor acetigenus]ADQ42009.1 hypothetical protein Calkr_2585 [Caldicellulosiruptor acetigenus I77R1B]